MGAARCGPAPRMRASIVDTYIPKQLPGESGGFAPGEHEPGETDTPGEFFAT